MRAGKERRRAPRERRPRLADLIDFELQLQRDRETPLERLQARDAQIAAELAGRGLAGRELLLAWLDALRERAAAGLGGPGGAQRPIGRRAEELRSGVSTLLGWVGLFVGSAAVAGWLLHPGGAPVNVIRLWLGVIGIQLPFLLYALGALPTSALRAVPGRALWAWLPALAAALLLRLPEAERGLARELAALRRLDWLYGRLRWWILCGLTQSFAIGFNVGALAAFVLISHIDDPAFGWRSRLFEAPAVERAVDCVALPWRAWLPAAVPSLEAIRATRYSSLDLRYTGPPPAATAGGDPWAAWWPFLLVSLLAYGLLPRLLLWAGVRWAAARAIARAPFAHADAQRLLERLERPALTAGAADVAAAGSAAPGSVPLEPIPSAIRPGGPDAPAFQPREKQAHEAHPRDRDARESSARETDARAPGAQTVDLAGRSLQVLCWAGVALGAEPLRARLAASTGARVAHEVLRVGAVERAGDARALEALRVLDAGGAAALCVEAWEPPVADYTDFLRAARAALGAARPLLVWLVESDESVPAPARAAHLSLWRRQLAALGDPWLRVAGWPAVAAP